MKKDSIVVYWACHTSPDRQTLINLLWEPPKPLLTTLPLGHFKSGNYRACSGVQSSLKNTYTVIHPKTSSVVLGGSVESPFIESTNFDAWQADNPALKDRYRINYDFSWVFFCEEDLEMNVTPPYMHKNTAQNTAQLASGRFNIAKWFRPAALTYLPWEGKNTVTVTEGEPAIYFEFLTDKKIVLKQFEFTAELQSLSNQVAASSFLNPLESLKIRYERFTRSNRHKQVIKLIKDNLLE